MNMEEYNDLTLHTDKYQINMMYAHWVNGTLNKKRVFEGYFRKLPFKNGFAVFAGLERVANYIQCLRFTESDIEFLKEQEENYDPKFLDALKEFKFTGTIYMVKEGTIVFQNEALIRVEARVFEAQLIETAVLNFINYQTLIATKAARIRQVVPNDTLLEFGTRRAQEADAAIWGARATYISGFHATSNMRAGKLFKIPTKGTHAHAWVQDHDSELEAFMNYAKAQPNNVTLLVDTYDTLRSGVPNAIKVGKWLEEQGFKMKGIRLDSGDLAYLSIEARKMLDEAGLDYVKIVASNDLDENTIFNLKAQGSKIDTWGIGTQLITAADQPSLGGVYKVVARDEDGEWIPTIKISGNPEKVTTPGFKKTYRIISKTSGKAEADYISLINESPENEERIKLFDPVHTWMHKFVTNFEAVELLQPIFIDGELVYQLPDIEEIRQYHNQQLELFWPEYLRKMNPEIYPVDLSQKTYDMKMKLIHEHMNEINE
ncbi:Nicotinate phosphoribosyltransferase pncB2 [compost metagenome]